mgnify:CR=1 FL=1
MDVFRKEYRAIDDIRLKRIEQLKEKAQALYDEIESAIDNSDQRMRALARTKLEEAVMWAVKAIT